MVAALEGGPAIAEDVDSTAVSTREAQLQLWLDMEKAGAFKPTALDLPPDTPYETTEALANYLGQVNRRTRWYLGDLLVFSENAHGELYAQVAHATGLNEQYLLDLLYVAKNVPRERRRDKLSYDAHRAVASLPSKEQKHWLDKAEAKGWNAVELRAAMKAKRRDEKPQIPGAENPGDAMEVLRAIVRDAKEHDDGQHVLVPNETYARVKAALGIEDDAPVLAAVV